jgi:penicillin-binding protein 2
MSTTEKRVILCYALAVVLFSICILRIFAIIKDPKYFETAQTVSSRTVMLNYSRGSIFDTRNQRLTNGKNVIYAVIFGNPETVAVLYKYFSGPQIESITEEIGRQGFALRTVSEKIKEEGIYCFSAFSHADDSLLAKHIIGYTDSQGKGVCGIEAAFDEQLTGKGKNTITFTLDGHGKVLKGEEPRICYDYEKENSGVRLTLDASIQQLAEQEAMAIDVGAVIVSEVKTGKIRALVSRPDYRITDLSSALSKEGQPLLNRALCTYNIGSVFKPYVAAAGNEAGITSTVNCVGYTDVNGLTFACHNLGGHGETDVTSALKYSCNSYFYSYIQLVTAQRVAKTAKKAGFESAVYLAEGIVAKAGSLGNVEATELSKSALCNFSIGQGELLLSP